MPARTERAPNPYAAGEVLHDSLLDAACQELRERRWQDITMADVALAAGVSRQTLYNEFGSRAEFAQALVLREAARLLQGTRDAVIGHREEPARALSAAFDVFLDAAAANPLIRAVMADDGAGALLALLTTHGGELVADAAEQLTAIIVEGWPRVRRADAELLSECLVRLAISYAVLPHGSSRITADSVATLLGPYVEALLERS